MSAPDFEQWEDEFPQGEIDYTIAADTGDPIGTRVPIVQTDHRRITFKSGQSVTLKWHAGYQPRTRTFGSKVYLYKVPSEDDHDVWILSGDLQPAE